MATQPRSPRTESPHSRIPPGSGSSNSKNRLINTTNIDEVIGHQSNQATQPSLNDPYTTHQPIDVFTSERVPLLDYYPAELDATTENVMQHLSDIQTNLGQILLKMKPKRLIRGRLGTTLDNTRIYQNHDFTEGTAIQVVGSALLVGCEQCNNGNRMFDSCVTVHPDWGPTACASCLYAGTERACTLYNSASSDLTIP